jgi:hypothetical protein
MSFKEDTVAIEAGGLPRPPLLDDRNSVDEGDPMPLDDPVRRPDQPWSRRTFLKACAAATAAALFPGLTAAAPRPHAQPPAPPALPIDPYTGAIPLTFPLLEGTYQTPLGDNWHAAREGQLYAWNHRNARRRRAHDGVDLFPVASQPLPAVYAPVSGRIAAVCWRERNTIDSRLTYLSSRTYPPPWDYSTAVDTVANLPLYGNFLWIYSTDSRSTGYFVFYCHLQNEPVLRSLTPDTEVSTSMQLGVLGDSGNAVGEPQLHVEIHYPKGVSYRCTRCQRPKTVTALNAYASLIGATKRQLVYQPQRLAA